MKNLLAWTWKKCNKSFVGYKLEQLQLSHEHLSHAFDDDEMPYERNIIIWYQGGFSLNITKVGVDNDPEM